MPWVTRGLAEGIVTTPYPRRPDGYGEGFRAAVEVRQATLEGAGGEAALSEVVGACPTGAISVAHSRVRLDRGRCVVCGRCVVARPDVFSFVSDVETAVLGRDLLVVPEEVGDEVAVAALRTALAARVRALRRSVHIRHVDCGSDGAEEWEIAALTNPVYDVQRLGLFFTASPRHADVLLVTGAGAAGMRRPLEATYEAMAEPRVVVAVGTDAASGGLFRGSYATREGVGGAVPVDVYVPGSPPSPFSILHGILLAVGLVQPVRGRA